MTRGNPYWQLWIVPQHQGQVDLPNLNRNVCARHDLLAAQVIRVVENLVSENTKNTLSHCHLVGQLRAGLSPARLVDRLPAPRWTLTHLRCHTPYSATTCDNAAVPCDNIGRSTTVPPILPRRPESGNSICAPNLKAQSRIDG